VNDLARTLLYLRPGAEWSLTGATLDGLLWLGPGGAPSQAEVDAAMPDALTAAAWDAVRVERGALLAGSDWTQVADAPVDAAAWAVYRQKLRDVPQDFASPDDVVWPEQP